MAQKSSRPKPSLKQEEPPAPWGSFPLVELCVLVGLILIVIGAIRKNPIQLTIGLGLGSLGGAELSIREHFAGYRSHTTLLAAVVVMISAGLMFFVAGQVFWLSALVGLTLGGVTWGLLRRAFIKASGGLSYKLR
ncbi:MAG TPA: hypothetical protein VMF31_07630 [Solirubrobacterales bacterium]|nr:hypothetical protein [Solirubrobacterales bacterium]